MNTDIDILLAKYFGGEASPNELDMLDDWLAQSEDNQEYFNQLTLLYEKTSGFLSTQKPDAKKAWEKFERHMQQSANKENIQDEKPDKRKRTLKFYIQIAAVFIVFISVSMLIYLSNNNRDIHTITALNNVIEHTMPDGSKLSLSPGSKVIYNNDYAIKNRNINLTGKVSVDVGARTNNKLVISAGETFIEDIGTVFTVTAYPNDTLISVFVESGKVLFYTNTNNQIELIANETGVYNKQTKSFAKHLNKHSQHITSPAPIIFDATPLSEAVEILSSLYNVSIELIESKLKDMAITVNFEYDEGIENILQVITMTLQLNMRYEDNIYKLYSR